MPIISLSLNEKILNEIDKLEKEMGFSGRSEVVRASIRHFVVEEATANKTEGNLYAVLLVSHSDTSDDTIAEATHRFDDIVITHLHSKAHGSKCLETFIVDGAAVRVKAMFKSLQSNRNAEYVKLLVI